MSEFVILVALAATAVVEFVVVVHKLGLFGLLAFLSLGLVLAFAWGRRLGK
jgi:hypothetical protein